MPPRSVFPAITVGVLALLPVTRTVTLEAQQADAAPSPMAQIDWAAGPVKASLGDVAEVSVPASCRFTDEKGAKLFMEATQNPTSGHEKGILLCGDTSTDAYWFVVFTYDASGLVRDDESATLDQAAILKTLQRGTEAGNEERRRRGWEEIELTGWQRPPYYDSVTHNLTWSTIIRGKSTPGESVNHSVRLLGRGGVMHADLVANPSEINSAVTVFDEILTGYSFVAGQRYAEWREGDKVAEYGLTALIAGGAGVAAAKLGLFGKLWKFILAILIAGKKLLIVAAIGLIGLAKTIFGKKSDGAVVEETSSDTSSTKSG